VNLHALTGRASSLAALPTCAQMEISQHSVIMFTPCNRGNKMIEITPGAGQDSHERRTCARAVLGCPIILFRPGCNPIRGDVQNISSDGFYCTCAERFHVGDSLWCDVQVTLAAVCVHYTDLIVSCSASVVRVEELDGCFGIGCKIHRFSARVRLQGSGLRSRI
jgi:PilZ domain